jgi:hypothetical protein
MVVQSYLPLVLFQGLGELYGRNTATGGNTLQNKHNDATDRSSGPRKQASFREKPINIYLKSLEVKYIKTCSARYRASQQDDP